MAESLEQRKKCSYFISPGEGELLYINDGVARRKISKTP